MSTAETNFRNSLRNFQSARAGPINLGSNPTTTEHPNPFAATFSSFQSGASSVFSNVRNTVQGYVPLPGLGTQDPQEPSWLQLSTYERLVAFAFCFLLGVGCFCLAFFVFLSIIPIFPGKFAATFSLGSILMLISVALLRGPVAHLKHMISRDRLPFSAAYLGSLVLTLYFSMAARSYILTLLFSLIQVVALLWYFGSYIPGGVSTLRYGGAMVARQAASLLPV